MANEQELGDDFSYMLRMADTDIDGLRPLRTALTASEVLETALQLIFAELQVSTQV